MPNINPRQSDVSTEYAVAMIRLLEERGVSHQQILCDTGLDMDQLSRTLRLSTDQDALLLSNAVRLTNDPGIGFVLGNQSSLTSHGFLGYGLMSCATLGEALELWVEYLDIRTTSAYARIKQYGGVTEFQIYDLAPSAAMRECTLDRLVTMTARLCTQLTNTELLGLELWLSSPEPARRSNESSCFSNARFRSCLHQIRIPTNYLTLQLPTANVTMLKQIREQCEQERFRSANHESLVLRIKDFLTNHQYGYPNLETTAKAFNVSGRTLKRKLQQYDLSFRKVVDEVRKTTVLRDVITSTLSMETIATRAGYTDPANLTRAVRRWTGCSPSHYRATFTLD